MAKWDESKHPRHPAGAPASKGGEFAPLDLYKDGIIGHEISYKKVPLGNDAFQYAVGKVVTDEPEAVFRRRASDRGTYGGWRWETDIAKLTKGKK